MVIDPYNYYNMNGFVNDTIKSGIAEAVEPHLSKLIAYQNYPERNIILGDSRSNSLYQCIERPGWANLAYGGSSIEEMFQTFRWVIHDYEIDTVLIGVSFYLYNKYNRRFWVQETLKRKGNFFAYSFNRYTFKSICLILERILFGKQAQLKKVPMKDQDFWDYQINVTSKRFMGQYIYPRIYYHNLLDISTYCNSKGITLIFWIPPSHVEFQNKIDDYGLAKENEKFLCDISSLGTVYDFDYSSDITSNRANFSDPLHFDKQIGEIITREIFENENKFAKIFNKNPGNKNPMTKVKWQ